MAYLAWDHLNDRQKDLVTTLRPDLPKFSLQRMEYQFEISAVPGVKGAYVTNRVAARHTKETYNAPETLC